MNDAPASLFDVGRVRTLEAPTIGVPPRERTLVVLGSTQATDVVDAAALARDGVSIRRRNGGGGAVLLRPADCWVELWLPARLAGHDVRATAGVVGSWWSAALSGLGLTATRHVGGVVDAAQGAIACFAGLGPGELEVDGRKLLGLSQWRAREGALVSSVLAAATPSALGAYLSASAPPTPALWRATCVDEALPGVTAAVLAAAFEREVAQALPGLVVSASPFC